MSLEFQVRLVNARRYFKAQANEVFDKFVTPNPLQFSNLVEIASASADEIIAAGPQTTEQAVDAYEAFLHEHKAYQNSIDSLIGRLKSVVSGLIRMRSESEVMGTTISDVFEDVLFQDLKKAVGEAGFKLVPLDEEKAATPKTTIPSPFGSRAPYATSTRQYPSNGGILHGYRSIPTV